MRRDVYGWHSPRMGMHMPIARYGHWGRPVLLIPTWQSDFLESERQGLISAVAHHLEAGRFTLFCINSVSPLSWCNDSIPVPEKARRQALFASYLEEEVVPHIRESTQSPDVRPVIGGASFGAFFAATALFRRPDLFSALLGMSGFYELGSLLQGHSDENVYFHNPGWFVPNLPEGEHLHRLRTQVQVELLTGQGAWEHPQASVDFSRTLHGKGIPHRLEVWGHDMAHDWPTWRRMLQVCLDERLSP
jgi:esterase/lipase superfamily enzyme